MDIRVATRVVAVVSMGLGSLAGAEVPRHEQGDPIGEITLEQALAAALARNPGLRVAALEPDARSGALIQAGMYPNPSLEVEASSGPGPTASGGELAVRLRQGLEPWGRVDAKESLASRAVTVSRAALRGARFELELEVRRAFVEVLVAQEGVALAEAEARLAQEVSAAAEARVAAGSSPPLDLARTRILGAMARSGLTVAQARLQEARIRLARTWGVDRASFSRVEGRIRGTGHPSWSGLVARLGEHPVISTLEAMVEEAEARFRLEGLEAMPPVGLVLGAQRTSPEEGLALVLGLELGIPAFDRNQGRVAEARARVIQARARLAARVAEARSRLRERLERLRAEDVRVRELEGEVLPGAEAIFQGAKRAYEAGKLGILELLDAQSGLILARRELLAAKRDQGLAWLAVLETAGTTGDEEEDE